MLTCRALVAWFALAASTAAVAAAPPDQDWPAYGGDPGGMKY